MKRSPMKPRSKPMARGASELKRTELKRTPFVSKPRPRVATIVRNEASPKLFWETVCAVRRCAVCGTSNGIIDAHHVTPKRILKRIGARRLLWDAANGMPVCRLHHDRHESAHARIPLAKVPLAAIHFAASLDQLWRLERDYPGPYPAGWQPNTEGRT